MITVDEARSPIACLIPGHGATDSTVITLRMRWPLFGHEFTFEIDDLPYSQVAIAQRHGARFASDLPSAQLVSDRLRISYPRRNMFLEGFGLREGPGPSLSERILRDRIAQAAAEVIGSDPCDMFDLALLLKVESWIPGNPWDYYDAARIRAIEERHLVYRKAGGHFYLHGQRVRSLLASASPNDLRPNLDLDTLKNLR